MSSRKDARTHFFGTLDVIGKRFGYGEPQFEIVGVVQDARVDPARALRAQ